MDIQIRTATVNDYESVIKIISQVQDMHVEWRPDIYRHNNNLISKEVFEKIVESNIFFVAENDNELQVNARNRDAYEMYKKYGFTEKSINMELLV